jgi:two-component system nitrate/nitrite response regulator NarL
MTSASVKRTRVLIVDDHPTFCEGLEALFQRTDDFEIVGKALTSSAALKAARELRPEIIMLDVMLGNEVNSTTGLDLVHQLRRICPQVKIAVLTASSSQEHLMNALRVGVQAYLLKDLAPNVLVNAVRQVRDGERVIGNPKQMTIALTQFQAIVQERALVDCGLTDAELEMLRLAAEGYNNKQIAAQQFWSEITVKRKMQSVYRKLGVSTRAQAVAEAIRRGFV